MSKENQKKLAVELRRLGLSYSEILNKVPVAKSTLSLWLREIGMAKKFVIKNTEKRLIAAKKGSLKRKSERLVRTELICKAAASEIGKIDLKSFWVAGAALYWAEGNKQKEHNVSSRVLFSNSDPEMMAYFQKWVKYFCNVTEDELGYELYIHKNDNLNSVLDYWCELLKISKSNLKVRFKIGNTESYRKNKYENYKGLIRMTVLKSTDLNRRIMSWAKECNKQFKIYSEIV